jgi:hypothetical protein
MSFVVNPYMFGLRNQFWTDLSSTAGKVITGFSSSFTNAMTVNWGDGTSTPLTSGVSVNKTLGTTNAVELETNNAVVTTINCGTSSPRLGGTVDISAFPDSQEFRCNSNDITALSGYAQNSNLEVVQFFDNKVTGSIPSLSGLTNLLHFRCEGNQFTGSIPSLNGLTQLRSFWCYSNRLSGTIPSLNGLTDLRAFRCNGQTGTVKLDGPIPSLSGLHNLEVFSCNANQLTGPIPSLTGLTSLREFNCATNRHTGPIPSLQGLTALQDFFCHFQAAGFKLTGSIPILSDLTNLENFYCYTNLLTGFDGGSVSNTLGNFQAQNNQLNQSSVNSLLSAFVAGGRTSASGTCILMLGGTGNAAPSGQGLTDKQTLLDRGWRTVTGSTAITN